MSNARKIQVFLDKNKDIFLDFDFDLEQNNNISKVFNTLSNKYDELVKNKIVLNKPIERNFKQVKKYKQPNYTKKKRLKKTRQTNKYKRGGVRKTRKTIKREFNQMNVYLNNLNSCDHFQQKDNFRSKYIQILELLYNKYNNILQEIYQEHNYHQRKIDKLNNFFQTLSSRPLKEMVEWVNFEGILISRSIYVMFLNRRLPDEIAQLFGANPEILGEFTSLDIQYDIELNLPYTYYYNYKINGINLILEMHFPKRLKTIKPDNNLLYRIVFFNYISNNIDINLKLWYSNRKKVLPKKLPKNNQKYLGPREINSGCTTFTNSLPNKVSIWRKEEMNKVILHEVCHSLELEESINLNEFKEFIYTHFDIKREIPIRLFESYVETWADFVNILLIVKIINQRKNKRIFMNLIEIEIKWSLFQAAKILDFYDYSSFEEFYFHNGIEENNKTSKFLQKSNIFSYTILRSIIMFNLDKFMSQCLEYNPETLIIKDQIPQDIKISLIKDNLGKYSKILNNIINFIKNNKNDKNNIYQTTRLTCIE